MFLMIEDFHTNAEAYQRLRHDQLKLNDASWSLIDEYFDAFLPIHSAMMDFQSAKLSMSEFYVRWIKMKIEIEDVPAGYLGLKMLLTNAIYTREQVFFKCEAFIAALVLDPRFCFTSGHQLFNTEMLNRGIIQLIKIHQKLCAQREQSSFSSTEESIQLNASYSSNTSEEMIPMNSEEIDAEKVRRFIEYTGGGTRQGVANAASESDQDIRQLILKWTLNEPRVSLDVEFNILAYWKKNQKTKWNRLYEISQVVYGAAFSSVKVERDFSGFALVYSHLRTRISNDFLDSIIVVKNNLDLIDKIKFV